MSDLATAQLIETGWQPGRMLEELGFVYPPSDDVAAKLPRGVEHRAASILGRRDV